MGIEPKDSIPISRRMMTLRPLPGSHQHQLESCRLNGADRLQLAAFNWQQQNAREAARSIVVSFTRRFRKYRKTKPLSKCLP